MLTSKQRAQLRGLAAKEDTILIVGKGGISPAVVASARNALQARELVKGRVLESALISAWEAAEELAEICRAETVQVIGSKFVLYKRNETAPKLPLAGGKKWPAARKGAKDPAPGPYRRTEGKGKLAKAGPSVKAALAPRGIHETRGKGEKAPGPRKWTQGGKAGPQRGTQPSGNRRERGR